MRSSAVLGEVRVVGTDGQYQFGVRDQSGKCGLKAVKGSGPPPGIVRRCSIGSWPARRSGRARRRSRTGTLQLEGHETKPEACGTTRSRSSG